MEAEFVMNKFSSGPDHNACLTTVPAWPQCLPHHPPCLSYSSTLLSIHMITFLVLLQAIPLSHAYFYC